MADWFAQNAPAAQAPPSGNWFAQNAPVDLSPRNVGTNPDKPAAEQGFFHSLYSSIGPIVDQVHDAYKRGDLGAHAADEFFRGLTQQLGDFAASGGDIRKLPLIGPPAQETANRMQEQFDAGNYAGMAGSAASIVAPLAIPEIKAGGKAAFDAGKNVATGVAKPLVRLAIKAKIPGGAAGLAVLDHITETMGPEAAKRAAVNIWPEGDRPTLWKDAGVESSAFPTPAPINPISAELPSGRQVGPAAVRAPEPVAPRAAPAWQGIPQSQAAAPAALTPQSSPALPSGRVPGSMALAERIRKEALENKILSPDVAAEMLESMNEPAGAPVEVAPKPAAVNPVEAPEPIAKTPAAAAPVAEEAPAVQHKTDLEDLLERSLKDPVIARTAITELDEHLKAEGLKKAGEIIDKNQVKRALKLGRFLQDYGITPEHIEAMSTEQWHQVGELADVLKPSATTIQKTKDLMSMASDNKAAPSMSEVAYRSTYKDAPLDLNDQGILYTTPSEAYSKHWGDVTKKLDISPKKTIDFTGFGAEDVVPANEIKEFLEAKGVPVSDSLMGRLESIEENGGEVLQYFGQGGKAIVKALRDAGYDSARINEYHGDSGMKAQSTLLFDKTLAKAAGAGQ